MKSKRFITRFLRDERGQSTTEYILILAVVVMIAMKFKTAFGDKMKGLVDKLSGDIDKGLENTN